METVRAIMIEGQAVFDAGAPEAILATLRAGGLIVYPTDTLYALGVDPLQPATIDRLFGVNQRTEGQPVSIVVASLDVARDFTVIPPKAQARGCHELPAPI